MNKLNTLLLKAMIGMGALSLIAAAVAVGTRIGDIGIASGTKWLS